MAISPHKNYKGLTLIEVLIALAIIAIAMTAVIKATSQNIRGTTYLENKTVAFWVGKNLINQVRVGAIKLSDEDESQASTTMLEKEWFWKVSQEATPNNNIKKIKVQVFAVKDAEDSIVSLESYVYRPPANTPFDEVRR